MGPSGANGSIIRSLYQAADEGRLDTVAAFFSPEYRDPDANEARARGDTGREGLIKAFHEFRAGFPDTRHTIHDLVAEGDRVVVRISAEGTHTGIAFGHPPTGRRFRNDAIVIYRLAGGKIVERWSRERQSVLGQLETMTASGSPTGPS